MSTTMDEASAARYFSNISDVSVVIDVRRELLESLNRINTYNPPVQTCSTGWTFHGLYSGPTSIAYLFYRLHLAYPDMEFKNQSPLDWAQAYLDLSARTPKPSPDPNHCGIANETLACYALQAVMSRDLSIVNTLCSYQTAINIKTKDGSNEWLYGRAGYLYFLRLLRSVFTLQEYPTASKQISETISRTTERMFDVPQPWTWHRTEYLGAAHGTIGIITQITLSDPSLASGLQPLLDNTLDQQYPTGNFPSSSPAGTDKLVQFCHGSPGFILSLESIKPYFPAQLSKIETCIAKARQDVWKRGLLTKEPSLCHGIAGNVLAFDTPERVNQFLSFMTTESLENQGRMQKAGREDDFVGLYTGEAGRAWTWAVVDQRLPHTCIGYNDL